MKTVNEGEEKRDKAEICAGRSAQLPKRDGMPTKAGKEGKSAQKG